MNGKGKSAFMNFFLMDLISFVKSDVISTLTLFLLILFLSIYFASVL